METLVSIITPTYNSEKYIGETIRSVQNQTYPKWEMVIVDDCSSDNTESIVRALMQDDPRISFYQLQKNAGAGVARNQAVDLAKGRYIAFLDSDDLWRPEKLEKQVDFMSANHVPFAFSYYDCINEEGELLHICVKAPKRLHYWQLFFCNFVGNLTGIYDTHFFGKIPISSLRKRQDWMVWLTVLKKIRVAAVIPQSTAFYRIRKDSISSSKWKLLQHNFAVYRRFHGFNVFVSLCCLAGFLLVQLLIKPWFIKKQKPTK